MKRLVILNIILLILLTGCNNDNSNNKITITWNKITTFPNYLNQQYANKIEEINQKQNKQIVKSEEKVQSADVNPKPGVKKQEPVKKLPSSTETALKKERPTVEGVQEYKKPEGSPKDGDIKYENGIEYEYNEVLDYWVENTGKVGEIKQGETAEEVEAMVNSTEKYGY